MAKTRTRLSPRARARILASLAMMSASGHAAAQSLDHLQANLPGPLAEALSPHDVVRVSQYRLQMEEDGTLWTARVQPGRPAGDRIAVISPAREDWPKGAERMIAQHDAEIDGEIWCDTAEDIVSRDIRETALGDLVMTYAFRLPVNKDDDKSDRRFAQAAAGEIEIMRADFNARWKVHAMRVWLEKPFKPAIIAKINSFNMQIQCAASPSGRMYTAQTITKISGKAMGQQFDEVERMTISEVMEAAN